jgi:glucose/arabinose dehydrogenase
MMHMSSRHAFCQHRVDVRGEGEVEKLLTDIGRIRDVEVGPDGLVYLLLEHPDGGHIVRLVPDDSI